jgi:hypothetical protein
MAHELAGGHPSTSWTLLKYYKPILILNYLYPPTRSLYVLSCVTMTRINIVLSELYKHILILNYLYPPISRVAEVEQKLTNLVQIGRFVACYAIY